MPACIVQAAAKHACELFKLCATGESAWYVRHRYGPTHPCPQIAYIVSNYIPDRLRNSGTGRVLGDRSPSGTRGGAHHRSSGLTDDGNGAGGRADTHVEQKAAS